MSANCLLCRRPIDSLDDYLCLDVVEPVTRREHHWCFAHPICADHLGGTNYGIQLCRIADRGDDPMPFASGSDSLAGWRAHMGPKNWFWQFDALDAAHELARSLLRANAA